MGILSAVNDNKGAIAFSLIVMLAGSAAYFAYGGEGNAMGLERNYSLIFNGIRLKVAYDPDGTMHILANSKNNALARLKAADGNPIPEEESVVFGASEGARMSAEQRFSRIGGRLASFFGLYATVEGVLAKQDNPIDELTFLSRREMDLAAGDEANVYAKATEEGMPRLFFRLGINGTTPSRFRLAEGSMNGYEIHNLDGGVYYPLILGAKEARVMREEKLFKNTGDTIRGLFGRNFVVTGILAETNTTMDRLYFIPLSRSELGN